MSLKRKASSSTLKEPSKTKKPRLAPKVWVTTLALKRGCPKRRHFSYFYFPTTAEGTQFVYMPANAARGKRMQAAIVKAAMAGENVFTTLSAFAQGQNPRNNPLYDPIEWHVCKNLPICCGDTVTLIRTD